MNDDNNQEQIDEEADIFLYPNYNLYHFLYRWTREPFLGINLFNFFRPNGNHYINNKRNYPHPTFHYFARLGGRIYKARIPLLDEPTCTYAADLQRGAA